MVELVCRRDRTTFTPPARRNYDPSDEMLAEYTDVYQRANNQRWASSLATVTSEEFEIELQIPTDAFGPCYVRVFVDGNNQFAMGSSPVFVKKSEE